MFEWKGLAGCEDLADETLDRVARKLADGETIRAAEPERYVAGVARMVALEAARAAKRARPLEHEPAAPAQADAVHRAEAERVERCLDECLAKLPAPARELLIGYHVGDGGARIANRKRMSERMGIGLNALRIRMHRMRIELEACVAGCAKRATKGDDHAAE
jgi:DNA-directed RNA polymerase specialized sigma24 family protein